MMTSRGKVSPADLFTLGNGLLGFLAITYVLDGRPHMASISLLLAMVFDGLDGYVSRRLGPRHRLGAHLDSFSDLISFAIAPSTLIYLEFYDLGARFSLQSILTLLAAFLFLILAAVRLARFSMHASTLPHFTGVPTPAATFLVLMLSFLFGREGVVLTSPLPVVLSCIMISLLMVVDVPYPKMREPFLGGMALLGICLAILSISIYDLSVGGPLLPVVLSGIALTLILLYICASPFTVREGDHG